MGKIYGYARVSKDEQNLDLQLDALEKYGCSKEDIYTDKISGVKDEKPGLTQLLSKLKKSDIVVVWRIDRLSRSIRQLVNLIDSFRLSGVGFKSVMEGIIDTTSAAGELVFNIFSCLAQFERRLIQERTVAGLSAARARGKYGGRRKIEKNHPKVVFAKKMHADKSIDIKDIYRSLKMSRSTLYRYLSM